MVFRVFIEECAQVQQAALAQAIAERFSVPAAQIIDRLQNGRFQVKAGISREVAQGFMRFLEAEGALCSMEDEAGNIVERSVAALAPMPTLASVNGQDIQSVPTTAVENSAFLPPGFAEERSLEMEVELETPRRPEPVAVAKSPVVEVPVFRETTPVADSDVPTTPKATGAWHQPPWLYLANNPLHRFAIGVAFAVIVGFLGLHLYASGQEKSRYAPVIATLQAAYDGADTVASWERLGEVQKDTLESLAGRRKNIAITSLSIGLVLGGLFFWGWKRLIDWDRWRC